MKERPRIRALQMETLRVSGIRRMDNVPNARIRQLCVVVKGVNEKIDEDVLQWFSHVKRMENGSSAKRSV